MGHLKRYRSSVESLDYQNGRTSSFVSLTAQGNNEPLSARSPAGEQIETNTMNKRILHTMIRVRDLEASVDFYTRIMGMTESRRQDYPGGKFTLCFVGYDDGPQIELTHNWERESDYEIGDGFGHVAIGSQDIYALCEKIRESGGQVVREPGPMKHGTTHIAFVRDPDGYAIKLIQDK